MNTPTEQLSERLAALATTLSAATFAADPQAAARLQQLQGNHLELQCTAPKTTWHLLISEQALEVRSGPSPAPQAIVKGTAFDLLTWLLPGQHGNVEIEGDTSLLLELVCHRSGNYSKSYKKMRADRWHRTEPVHHSRHS